MPLINVFDTNQIRTTGLTVVGFTVLSGNSSQPILIVTGTSGTNLQVIDDINSPLLWGISGSTGAVFEVLTTSVNVYEDLNVTGNTNMTGTLSAAAKSFDIPHPSKENFRLRYGSLEGPEHGVYFRGKTTSNQIILPDYWKDLIHENSITIQLTPIGDNPHWVEVYDSQSVTIASKSGKIDTFYLIQGERKDIEKLEVEYMKSVWPY